MQRVTALAKRGYIVDCMPDPDNLPAYFLLFLLCADYRGAKRQECSVLVMH